MHHAVVAAADVAAGDAAGNFGAARATAAGGDGWGRAREARHHHARLWPSAA